MLLRRERLLRTLRGEAVDRPAVCFYEINGLLENPRDPDPFNIYSHPSWRPLLELAAAKTDRIVMQGVPFRNTPPDPLAERTRWHVYENADGSRLTVRALRADGKTLIERTRRDRDVNTVWTTEHLLKSVEDLEAYLTLPPPQHGGEADIEPILQIEKQLGDSGIVMLDTGDPLCAVAPLFAMADYLVVALTEPSLFRRALDRVAPAIYARTAAAARALPGRLWRIYGPEYASPPYLPPALFREYVVNYVKPMVDAIHAAGGYARVHSHGRLRDILDLIVETGCMGLDPIEPPPQGDVALAYVRERYGKHLVLFGNLEISEIETMPHEAFAQRVDQALREGTAGEGRGFVLMPSAAPYGRILPEHTLRNYEIIIDRVERFGG